MMALDQIAILYGEPMALLIHCCRVHFKTEQIEGLNERIAKTGEEKIEEVLKKVQLLSRLHRIRPVVYRALLNANVSIEFKTALKNELLSITLQNFEIAKETERIVKKLTTVGITAIPYKGVAFSKQFYGDISMRESTDIDLAIDASDLLAIQPQFEEDGYVIAAGMENPAKASTTYYTENKDLCFYKVTSNHQFHVELHWMVTHPRYQAPTNLNKINIAETVESELVDTSLRFLEPTEHFRVTLLHHLLHDGIEYLKLLVDIAQAIIVINKPKINSWDNNKKTSFLIFEKTFLLEQHYNVIPILQAAEELFGNGKLINKHFKNSIQWSIIDYCLSSGIRLRNLHNIFYRFEYFSKMINRRTRFIKYKKYKFSIFYTLGLTRRLIRKIKLTILQKLK